MHTHTAERPGNGQSRGLAWHDRRVDPVAAGSAPTMMDPDELEALVLNLDASVRVHARPHFFNWTQGLLQSLMPHAFLICALRSGDPNAFRIDCFSTLVPDADDIGGLLLRDASSTPSLIRGWRDADHRPAICNLEDVASLADGEFARELGRIRVRRLLVHGLLDADGEINGIYIFCCGDQAAAHNLKYRLELLTPFLHAAWIRAQTTGSRDRSRQAPVRVHVLTDREREVLSWIYLGKSNAEIGTILDISPLTVKNHVQSILRKLNVVNRAQAVGKALEARIIAP